MRESANGNGIAAAQGFSQEWIAERARYLAGVEPQSRRWLLEVAFGRVCLTSVARAPVAADGRALFHVQFFPLVSLSGIAPESLAQAVPCTHAHLGELAHLTRRELEVYRLLGRGASNTEVAKSVVRTTRLVESVTLRLRRSLGGDSLRRVIAHSAQSGLYCLNDEHFAQILANHHPRRERKARVESNKADR